MTFTAFLLILISVLLHATWHFLSKSRRPAPAFFLLVSLSGLAVLVPLAGFSGLQFRALPPEFFWFLLGGGLSGTLCDIGLSVAYRRADVSLAYPLARAIPVLLTALVTGIFCIGAPPGAVALWGMGEISAGCVLMPLSSFADMHWRSYFNPALFGILLAAAGTTGYTICDSQALKLIAAHGGTDRFWGAAAYSAMRETVLFSTLFCYVALVPGERRAINRDLFRHPHPYFAGLFASGAYLLVLLAMGFVTNVSFVQAFRQMSLPVGVLLGMVILKERCTLPRTIGILLVLAGLVLTAFR